ncbi:MAG: UDP binding domain-containing protein [Chloroflexota bacterium]
MIVLTEWPEYCRLDYEEIKRSMARPILIDARNLLDAAAMRDLGFSYCGVGRPA